MEGWVRRSGHCSPTGRRFSEIRRDHGKVALVGVSLGGLFARNLAYERAYDISHVATVASPFRLPMSANLAPLVRLCARRYSQAGPARTPARTTSCARHGDLYTRRRHRCLGQLLRRKFC
jgi:esterase/lipase